MAASDPLGWVGRTEEGVPDEREERARSRGEGGMPGLAALGAAAAAAAALVAALLLLPLEDAGPGAGSR